MRDLLEFSFFDLGFVEDFYFSVFEVCGIWAGKFKESILNDDPHIGFVGEGKCLGWRLYGFAEFDDCVDVAFAVDEGVEFGERTSKEVMRFDDFESFIEEGGRFDENFWTH